MHNNTLIVIRISIIMQKIKFKALKNLVFIGLTALFSTQSHALAVSSLFEVADQDTHMAEVEVINNDKQDMFINVEMSKVKYVDGKKTYEKLNKDNVISWDFNVSPSQLILKPGEKKKLRMKIKCEDGCDFHEDQVYAIDIKPVPYYQGKKSAVAVAFGYRVYFLDPVSKKNIKLKYKLKKKDNEHFIFENNSNTMLNAVINTCEREFVSNCIFEHRLLPNSKRVYSFPKSVKDGNATFNVINANEEINEKVAL